MDALSSSEVDLPLNATPSSSSDLNGRILRFAVRAVAVLVGMASLCAFMMYRYGLPEPTGYTACPMAFFYAGFIMIATGGMLGLSLATTDSRLFHWRVLACLALATCFLGVQSYGIWCLAHVPQRPESSLNAVAMMMAIFHCGSTLAISLLIAYASAHTTPKDPPSASKSILKICALYWYGLGFSWTFLLCMCSLI